jgi:hypothetical protein
MIPFLSRNIFPRESGMAIATMAPQPKLVAIIIPAIPMADFASRRRAFENIVQMAVSAVHISVSSCQGEIRPVVGVL